MNETVMKRPATMGLGTGATPSERPRKRSSAFQWYFLLTLLIALGWILRDQNYVNPEEGVGYWLGIVGGSVMLILILYPVRKRSKLLRMLGPTTVWFRWHIILGLVGPLLILYHCNFSLGSFNSQVALYCMLLVAGSGIIGRHFYAGIHRGLYGRKTTLGELQRDLVASLEKSQGLAKLMPQLVTRLDRMSGELQGCQVTQSLGVGRSLRWTFTHHFVRLSLLRTARRELKAAAAAPEYAAMDFDQANRAASRYICGYTKLMGKVAQFSFYERMFAVWHIFHLPIFYMMILTALFHVLAVHMY